MSLVIRVESFEMDFASRKSKTVTGTGIYGLLLLVCIHLAGCTQMTTLLNTAQQEETLFAEAEKHREEFLSVRSPESIQWLLANLMQNGMSKGDVDRVLGEHGSRYFDDKEILSGEGLYRLDDIVYSWGPDKQGNAYMLVFRDNNLINYDNSSKKNDLPQSDKFL